MEALVGYLHEVVEVATREFGVSAIELHAGFQIMLASLTRQLLKRFTDEPPDNDN